MKKLSQKGFGAIETLLVLILIAIVAFAGYYVYHSQKTADNTYSSAGKVTQNTPTTAPVKYLDVKELGVKFKLSNAISDAYYEKDSSGYYRFSVHSFDKNAALSGCSLDTADSDGIVTLEVTKVGESSDFAGDPWTVTSLQQAGYTQVGDTYYAFQKGNGACYDPDTASQADQNEVSNVIQAFETATSTITKD